MAQTATGDVDVDLGSLFSSLVRNWLKLLVAAVVVAAAAFFLTSLVTPRYQAETRLLIETRESVFTRPQGGADADRPILDEEGVTSQVEVITSTDILRQVAKQFDLASRPEFDEVAGLSTFGRLLVLVGLKSDPGEVPAEERVLKAFRDKLSVYRVEKSRVIVVSFSSQDPKLAADVPNAIADAYLQFSRDAKLQSNAAATDWLEPEIKSLTTRVRDAEAKVAEFKAQSDLLSGTSTSALANQQLSELSSELSRVRANRASAEANADAVRQAISSGSSLDAFPEIVSSGLIQRLRERQVQLKADIADLSTTLLDNHPRIRSMKSQLADLDRQIAAEGSTILRGLVNEAKTAQLREEQLVANLNQLKAESSRVGEKEVELRALEREATSQRELLESYLTRFREAASRRDGNYLPADARIFSRAVVPQEPFFPKTGPIVGAAFAATLLLSAIVILLRELFSGRAMRPASGSRFEPVEQVRMPVVAFNASSRADTTPNRALGEISVGAAARMLMTDGVRRVLFVSPEGDEAAASSVMVARAVADSGRRVVLVDLNANGAASEPMLEGEKVPGITDLLSQQAQFVHAIHADHFSDCHVIPVGVTDPVVAMRSADRLPSIMDSLTAAYDVVIVECGPATAQSIRSLVSADTEVMVSMIEPVETVAATARDLVDGGYRRLTLVTPIGQDLPPSPEREAA
jgi:uncharacterized protein involved in exopolysaccharide biosynthesis/Mrp family chromosome partitioning ATPase